MPNAGIIFVIVLSVGALVVTNLELFNANLTFCLTVSTTITPAVPFSSTSRATNVPTTIAQIFTSINSSSIFTTSKISSTLNPTTTAASAASIPTTKSMISTATSGKA